MRKAKRKPQHRLKCGACGAAFSASTRELARRKFDAHDCRREQQNQKMAQSVLMGGALGLLTQMMTVLPLPPSKGTKKPKTRTPNPAHPRWLKSREKV